MNANLGIALDRIAERAADVRRAYTPGAVPAHDDVATPAPSSDFTLNPLAVVAPDGAYFVTGDEQGARRFTRDGVFSLRAGTLVDADGWPILGEPATRKGFAELTVDPVDQALDRVRDVTVERDGTVIYYRDAIDPRSGNRQPQRVVVGRIALARFPAGTRLQYADGSNGIAPPGVAPQTGFPGENGFAPLVAMRRERSRVDVDQSIIRLKEAYLAFEALQAAEMAKGHFGKTAIELLK